jgi:hypothetical protein
MQLFKFEPALFGHRADAQEALSRSGYDWFAQFSTIDLLHDVFGIEVCGIAKESDAVKIAEVLRRTFPSWKYCGHFLPVHKQVDIGWKAVIHRDPHSKS